MNENEEEISNDREDAPAKGRSFGKANEYDNPIGLTQAFALLLSFVRTYYVRAC